MCKAEGYDEIDSMQIYNKHGYLRFRMRSQCKHCTLGTLQNVITKLKTLHDNSDGHCETATNPGYAFLSR